LRTIVCYACRPGINFCARSALPIGAGLGSSASYSTCVAAAFLRLHNRISVPLSEDAAATSPSISGEDAALVDQWAFLAEKINHGNPSGIDNAVAVRGGAVSFARAINGREGGMASLQGRVSRSPTDQNNAS
jgi:mevalonate kinase